MDANCNYQDLQCADLKHIMKTKGFPFLEQHLADLCERADALNFPGIDQNDSEKEVINLETDGSRENFSTSKLRHWHRLEP